jgi:hypothetical protein
MAVYSICDVTARTLSSNSIVHCVPYYLAFSMAGLPLVAEHDHWQPPPPVAKHDH